MAYGKRHVPPPVFPAAVTTPGSAGPQVRRGAIQRFFVPSEDTIRRQMNFSVGLMAVASVALLGELASHPSTAWLGVPLLLIVLAVGVIAARRAVRQRQHLLRSVTAPATVTGARQVGGLAQTVRPTVRFTSNDGVVHDGTASFPQRALGEGTRLTVRYDPLDPTWVVVDGRDFGRSIRTVQAVASLAVLAAAGLVYAAVGLLTA